MPKLRTGTQEASMRPRATHKDENHFVPRNFLRDRCGGFEVVKFGRTTAYVANYKGDKFVLFDMSDYGGVFSDWLLCCVPTGKFRWLESKTKEAYKKPNHDATDGELWLMGIFEYEFKFVVDDDDIQEIMQWIED